MKLYIKRERDRVWQLAPYAIKSVKHAERLIEFIRPTVSGQLRVEGHARDANTQGSGVDAMQKNLCNTNRLRVTVGRHLMAIVPHIRLREWVQFARFFSNDHGRGRERNYSMTFGPFWLLVKWRPNGKSSR